ncbi:dsDNA nuclease domain-containing protein [Cytobacillus kochii]|uniref:dsDNA nuclease domain-containing protein n=1 Tax=Cytobacillus kochii TaxID=859143 RepID=UPI00247FB895|nr:dsDNA nuclease domain-containing protein [Cytobacillus kochii]
MSAIDNGGAIAIKGFNYQKASIILVMIHNFEKDNFIVIPESREDFEIHLEQDTYFIQVKGTKKLSIGKLKSRPSGKASIIEKNLSPGTDGDIRKIFLWDVATTTKNELISQDGTLVPIRHSLSTEQKTEIINDLGLDEDQKIRMNNQYIYITPFSNDLNLALTFLKGEMVNENLLVTNDRAKVVLGELSLEIDQKSEIEVTTASDIKRKGIDGEYLKQVFVNVQQKELFDEVLNNLSINTIMKNKVKKAKLRIPLLYQNIKEQMKQKADISLLMSETDEGAVNYLRDLLADIAPEMRTTDLSIALAIDYFCELGE